MNNEEFISLYNYILKNCNIGDNTNFTKEDLSDLFNSFAEDYDYDEIDVELTEKQEKEIINTFLASGKVIDEDTPLIIKRNKECIIKSIQIDIRSINDIVDDMGDYSEDDIHFDSTFDNEYHMPDYALEEFYKQLDIQGFALSYSSPSIFKKDLKIALASIEKDPDSVRHIYFSEMSDEDCKKIVNRLIELDYCLNSLTPDFLCSNEDLVIASIKKNKRSIEYVSTSLIKNNVNILKLLIENGRAYSWYEMKGLPLSLMEDKSLLRAALKAYFDEIPAFREFGNAYQRKKFLDRLTDVYHNVLMTPLTIEDAKKIFDFYSEQEWKDEKIENRNLYDNLFNRICAYLRRDDSFENNIDDIPEFERITEKLGDKYKLLEEAMKDYYDACHNSNSEKSLDESRDRIAKYCGLFLAKEKDGYIHDIIENDLDRLSHKFKLREDNPFVKKELYHCAQKSYFHRLMHENDPNVKDFISQLENEYIGKIDYYYEGFSSRALFKEMVRGFLCSECSKLDKFIRAPRGFNNYKRWLESKKLVNRLNSGFIKYTDLELNNYRDVIHQSDTGVYFYDGPEFTEEAISRYEDYKKLQRIYDEIKMKIIKKSESLEPSKEIIDEVLNSDKFNKRFKFTDEFFEFNREEMMKDLCIREFRDKCFWNFRNPEIILNDDIYKAFKEFTCNSSVIQLMTTDKRFDSFEYEDYSSAVEDFEKLYNFSKIIPCNFSNYGDVMSKLTLATVADTKKIAALGEYIITTICEDEHYTRSYPEERANIAYDLAARMVLKNECTVPYINGETTNYRYSMYDSQDLEALLCGTRTDACFKVDGVDNDFFHYCTLNKNGFIIKIEDKNGNFVGRAGGFRNGNCVFINQLRTIFDIGQSGYCNNSNPEKYEIIETFKQACNDIVKVSQENPNETEKIDHVFATQSYALSYYHDTVSHDVEREIGSSPMRCDCPDWRDFCENTKNLQSISVDSGFTTDYGNYKIVCMASIKEPNKIKSEDIVKKDSKPVYRRKRNNIIISLEPDDEVINKIERINSLSLFYNEENAEYKRLDYSKDALYIVGDNWFYIWNLDSNNKTGICLSEDKFANIEYTATDTVVEEFFENKAITKNDTDVYEVAKLLVNKLPKNYYSNSNN